jgi:hypothetical protein
MILSSINKSLNQLIIGLGLVLASTSMASAQSLPSPGQSETEWRNALGIYMFAPLRTKGTSTVGGATAPIDMDLGDVLEVLDFALSGRYEAWKGDWGFIADASYMSIGDEGALPGPLGSTFSVDVRQKWLGLLAAYRVVDGTYGANNQRFTVDIQGGLRYNALKQEVNISTPGPITPPTIGGDETWVEPVIGARGMWRLNDQWTTMASLDLGGFGAGGDDLQVGANIGFDYKPWDNTSIVFGYRYYSIDYSTTQATGAFAYDVEQHGPYIGMKFNFN